VLVSKLGMLVINEVWLVDFGFVVKYLLMLCYGYVCMLYFSEVFDFVVW